MAPSCSCPWEVAAALCPARRLCHPTGQRQDKRTSSHPPESTWSFSEGLGYFCCDLNSVGDLLAFRRSALGVVRHPKVQASHRQQAGAAGLLLDKGTRRAAWGGAHRQVGCGSVQLPVGEVCALGRTGSALWTGAELFLKYLGRAQRPRNARGSQPTREPPARWTQGAVARVPVIVSPTQCQGRLGPQLASPGLSVATQAMPCRAPATWALSLGPAPSGKPRW